MVLGTEMVTLECRCILLPWISVALKGNFSLPVLFQLLHLTVYSGTGYVISIIISGLQSLTSFFSHRLVVFFLLLSVQF